MGVVYLAHDPRLDRHVAIKLLPPDLTRDETAKQRFLQEAKAASALDHLNICTIHEINETDDGQLYLVMAHYEGETLKERIARWNILERQHTAHSFERQHLYGGPQQTRTEIRAHQVARDTRPVTVMETLR